MLFFKWSDTKIHIIKNLCVTLKIQKNKKDLTKTLQFLSVLGNLFFFSLNFKLFIKELKIKVKLLLKMPKLQKYIKL